MVKRLGDGPHTAASLLAAYNWTLTRADSTTCATYIDKNGLVQTAAANTLRVQYEDLNGDGFRETPGILLEGSRTNAFTKAEKFDDAVWVKESTSTVTADATAAPNGATTADKIVEAAAGAGSVNHGFNRATPALTDSTKQPFSIFAKASSRTWIQVASINKASAIGRTWVNLATGAIGTTLNHTNTVVALANGWYRISISFDAGTGAGTPKVFVRPATGDNIDLYVGDGASGVFVWGAQFETDKIFPSSYIATDAAAVTRAADSLTIPVNFGPFDTTVLARIARPVHADASGDIGGFPGLWGIGTVTPQIGAYFGQASRTLGSSIQSGGGQSDASSSVPAGTTVKILGQFKDFGTNPETASDLGSGLSAFSAGTAGVFSAYANQTLRVGRFNGMELYGVLLDLKARQGLITLAAMQTEPGFSPANPIEVTELDAPGPLISKAQSGRVNLRSTQQIGRSWTERYLLQTTQASHKEFLARMTQYWRNGTIFPKGHVDYAVPKGLGSGFVLVKGASQTGSTLVVDGCPLNTVGWLLAGDIFRVQGLPQVFQASADVNSEGDGTARIPLVVPIFTGGSPSDNATLTLTGVTMDVVLLEPPSFPTTSGVGSDYGELVLKLSEAL